jgi:competence protein ComEC
MAATLFAAAWLLGVAAAAFTGGKPAAAVAAAGLLAWGAFLIRPRFSTLAVLPVAVAVVVLGAWRYEATVPDSADGIGALNGTGEVRLEAVIDADPIDRPTSRLYEMRVEAVEEQERWRDTDGRVLIRVPAFSSYRFGDRLVVEGEMEEPPEAPGFDYPAYLLRRGITSSMAYPETTLVARDQVAGLEGRVAGTRRAITATMGDYLPEPHASLAAGVLVGARSALPSQLRDDMAATGTAHMVAVSGQNIAMLAGIVIAALAWVIGRRPAAGLALLAVIGYSVLAGGQPSVVRAAIMGALYIAAIATGRQNSGPVALLLAAGVMAALDPQVVHEVSFQLSFAATIALVTLAPVLADHLEPAFARVPVIGRTPLERPVREVIAVSVSAGLATTPITAIAFGMVSPIGPVANLFVAPAFVAVAATSALLAGVAAVFPQGAGAAAWVAWLPAEYMVWTIALFARLPFAGVEVNGLESVWAAVAWYAALAAGAIWLARRPARAADPSAPAAEGRWFPALGLAAVLLAAALVGWSVSEHEPEGRVSVTVMDVGQGDAILVEDASGRRVLVDGGPRGREIRDALSRNLPFPDRRIDLVVLTHPQGDHYGGLAEVIDSYDVGRVLMLPEDGEGDAYADWLHEVAASGTQTVPAQRGQTVMLDGALLEVLGPGDGPLYQAFDLNERSLVVKLTAGSVSFLLTGDLGADGEEALLRSGADVGATVLKVGHHGSGSSTTEEFLSRVRPSAGVISVGKGNSYGHPAPEVLTRLEGVPVLRTDEDGDVKFVTDGTRLWVKD